MNIVILDDYQDVVRKLDCATKLEAFPAKVYTNTIKGLGQLSVRLKDADIIVLIRERTALNRALLEKLPRLKLIAQTGRAGSHIDLAACTERGIAVAEGVGSPIAPAELTWALIMAAMRRLPQYIGNLKHGAWQQSGLKSASMPANFGLGVVLRGKTLGIWGYGRIGQLVAGYGKAFGMQVMVWGSEESRVRAARDGHEAATSREAFFEQCDVLSVHLRLNDATEGIVTADGRERWPSTESVSKALAGVAEITLAATLVRFLYGLPFTLAWLLVLAHTSAAPAAGATPALSAALLGWVSLGAVAQIFATALGVPVARVRQHAARARVHAGLRDFAEFGQGISGRAAGHARRAAVERNCAGSGGEDAVLREIARHHQRSRQCVTQPRIWANNTG